MKQRLHQKPWRQYAVLIDAMTLTALEAIQLAVPLGGLRWVSLAAAVLLLYFLGPLFHRSDPSADVPEDDVVGWRKDSRKLLGFLERVLKGCENQRASGIRIPVQSPFFVVLGVDIAAAGNDADITAEALEQTEMRTCSALEAAFSDHSFWPMNIDGTLICVINLRPNPEDPLQNETMEHVVVPAMQAAADTLLAEGIQIRIATSGLTVGTESLHAAYQDAVQILEQLVFKSPDESLRIVIVDPRKRSTHADLMRKTQIERLYCNYIDAQDLQSAELALIKLTELEFTEQPFSVLVKRTTSNRMEWALDLLAGSLQPAAVQALARQLSEIVKASDFHALTEQIHAWFGTLAQYTLPRETDALVPRVMSYIAENCFRAELNVTMLSEQFHVNASYLSNAFHTQTGIKLIDYIHSQRLQRVKQLLRESKLSIAQIAEQTGYYNAMTMSRAFKRYEGVTPTAYRNMF